MKKKFVPLSTPNFKGNEKKYVTHALETEWVSTGGSYVTEFENSVSKYSHSNGAVSCQNGTAGLHIALILCGLNLNDEVLVPTLTFIAAINPVKYVGAEPVFLDCDDSLCIDPVKLKKFCEEECVFRDNKLFNKATNKHVKAVIVVHVFGNMVDMQSIMRIARKYNIKVIEDATEALGTYYTKGIYKGKYAGTIGDIGVYSFNGNKIITTGGGGMIVSNNQEYLDKAKHLTTQAKIDDVYYIHDEIGYNYRMTNIQAALGLAQLEQLELFVKVKEANYLYYKERIDQMEGLCLLRFRDSVRPNYWFYSLYLKDEYCLSRDELLRYFSSNLIQARPIWQLNHKQKPYERNQSYLIEKAEVYLTRVLTIPCGSNLSKEDVDRVVDVLMKARDLKKKDESR